MNKSEDGSNDISTSNMKSIETARDLFMKQTMFGKYFLRCLSIDVEDDIDLKIKNLVLYMHIAQTNKYVTLKTCTNGELFLSLNQLRGLKLNDDDDNRLNDAKFAEKMLSVVMRLIETKMVVTDDLLILCWEYAKASQNKYNADKNVYNYDSDDNKDEDDDGGNRFLKSLLDCVSDCLSGEGEYSSRSYLYFKLFLLHSNIWYAKDYKNDKLLFNYVDELADKFLMKQKLFIKESIENEEKKDDENWNKLCNYNKYKYGGKQLRQDKIVNGIRSFKSIKEVYVITADNWSPDYDVSSEFNDKVYITQCLAFAHENNHYFQDEMKKLLKNTKSAPVKTYDRCLVKSSYVYNLLSLMLIILCIVQQTIL